MKSFLLTFAVVFAAALPLAMARGNAPKADIAWKAPVPRPHVTFGRAGYTSIVVPETRVVAMRPRSSASATVCHPWRDLEQGSGQVLACEAAK